MRLVAFLAGLLIFLTPSWVQAKISVITSITLIESSGETRDVALPHFLRQEQSGLVTFDWRIQVPASLTQEPLPALLMPQPVQGATIWIGDRQIYEIAPSDSDELRNWYQPFLVPLPKDLLSSAEPTQIWVRQHGHLRGWFVAPMFTGNLSELQPYFDNFTWLNQTLSASINLLCGLIGFFLLLIGLRSRSTPHFFSGMATLTWGFLFSLALMDAIPTDIWFFWRLLLYFLTGWVIYFITLFMFEIFEQHLPRYWKYFYIAYLNSGWIIFIIFQKDSEYFLDNYWTGGAELVYAASMAWLITKTAKKFGLLRFFPFFIHGLISSVLAFHDYILQAGWLPFDLPGDDQALWVYMMLQPIYLTHLSLPFFAAMALWMLAQDHMLKSGEIAAHQGQMLLQREEIVREIHDGVGARINLLLWGLRSSTPTNLQLEHELQRCMDELRFTINPIESGHETLHKSLSDLCKRLQHQASTVDIVYERTPGQYAVHSRLAIHLYRAAQECLCNALRHSQASRIEMTLVQTEDNMGIEITDNGIGVPLWDEAAQVQTSPKITSLGLRGLQQRMLAQGGGCHISTGAHGTRINFWLPLPPQAPKKPA